MFQSTLKMLEDLQTQMGINIKEESNPVQAKEPGEITERAEILPVVPESVSPNPLTDSAWLVDFRTDAMANQKVVFLYENLLALHTNNAQFYPNLSETLHFLNLGNFAAALNSLQIILLSNYVSQEVRMYHHGLIERVRSG